MPNMLKFLKKGLVMPRESVKKDILDYIRSSPMYSVHHPEEVAKALNFRSVGNTRVLMRQLADDGFLEVIKNKNKRFFCLKTRGTGIDPSIVSWPVNKK